MLRAIRQIDARAWKVQVKSAAEFLKLRRTYQGLEAPVTGAAAKEPQLAKSGRSGRAASYKLEGRS